MVGISRHPVQKWRETGSEYMSARSWIRFAYFLAAGHDGEEMTHLRTIAFGLDHYNDKALEHNDNKIKDTVLKMAQNKMMMGACPPTTVDEVMKLGGGSQRDVDGE